MNVSNINRKITTVIYSETTTFGPSALAEPAKSLGAGGSLPETHPWSRPPL